MAKVSSPLWGFSADGAIGKSVVFARWKGVRYARRYAVASNPNTLAQQSVRGAFRWLMDLYRFAPATFHAPWEARVKGEPMTSRNMFVKANLAYVRDGVDLSTLAVSTPVAGGLAPVSGTITGGSGLVTIALDEPGLPTGWSIDHMVAVVITDQAPTGNFTGVCQVATDNTSPYSAQITGLDAGDYLGSGYFVYLRDDGTLAYGAPISQIVTVT